MDWEGIIYDYFGGVKDLMDGNVVFVGDATSRIREDYLRIMRYFRFLGRMKNPQVDFKTLQVFTTECAGLDKVSGERIWAEMQKILAGEHVTFIINMMNSCKVADQIGFDSSNGLKAAASRDPITVLAGFISEESVKTVIERWKLSNAEQTQLQWLVDNRFDYYPIEMMMAQIADGVEKSYFLELMKIQFRIEEFEELKLWVPPVFPVTGKDLISAGIKPGPAMGRC
jgi:tRNA nucleotidyltransferase (CCA-adding enzyme)